MWVTSSAAKALTPTAIALGNFDGIHRGHQQVLQPIVHPRSHKNADAVLSGDRLHASVVTFNPHPREFFSGQSQKLLSPLPEKIDLLENLGVDQLILLPFDRELAALSPQQFVETILVEQLQAAKISVGEDFHFGHQRVGTALDLQVIAANFDIEVTITGEQTCLVLPEDTKLVRISSSLIRNALEQGNISQANRMLGRPYSLVGTVVTGQKLGGKLGFPTANLQLPAAKYMPRFGVYGVRVILDKVLLAKPVSTPALLGVANWGCRPTVDGKQPIFEVHLLNWSGDLYGQTITIYLETFLRSEQPFASLEALKAQISQDCDRARDILTSRD